MTPALQSRVIFLATFPLWKASNSLDAAEIAHPYRIEQKMTLPEAERYCEKLAKSHYENFLVAGIFCPKPLRQHFYNVYSYCRISDDLSDEIGDPEKSLILLPTRQEV